MPSSHTQEKLIVLFPAETHSSDETMALGRELAERLEPGSVIALQGELGTGKTHLVKGVCSAFGVPPEAVTSPTFTLLHEYDGDRLPIYHFDAYRVEHPDEFYELGYEEYVYGQGLCFIEWPERVADLIPTDALVLRLTHEGGDRRRIELLQAGE